MEAKPCKRPSFSVTWARVSGSTTSRVLSDAPKGKPNILLLSTGSEVALCVQAYEQLLREGIYARVISMPCWRLFETEDKAYRDTVLPPVIRPAKLGRPGVEKSTINTYSRASLEYTSLLTSGQPRSARSRVSVSRSLFRRPAIVCIYPELSVANY